MSIKLWSKKWTLAFRETGHILVLPVSQIIGPKNFRVWKIFGPNFFGLLSNSILVQTFLIPEKIGSENLGLMKIHSRKNIIGQIKMLGKNNVGSKKCCVRKCFVRKFLGTPNIKMCSDVHTRVSPTTNKNVFSCRSG